MKEKNLQPRLLYPARISFRFDGEIKTFTDKQKLREFSTTKPALQQMLKELLWAGNTREDLQKRTQNNYENGNRNIHIDNCLKCKSIKFSPPKDIDWLNGHKNKMRIYAVYMRLTSNLGTHTD